MADFTIPKVPDSVTKKFNDIVTALKSFCDNNLNDEYYELSVALAAKIARKRPSPLMAGQVNTWAAGIIHTLGMVNFLFDKSQKPHMTASEIADGFELSKSTVSAKSNAIKGIFKIYQLDPKWTLPSLMDNNPRIWMLSVNDLIIDIRDAPYELQEIAFNKGLIPYIPSKEK